MAYQVIARKWRPQKFEEVTGQEAITRTLQNAVEQRRLHHAYLFSGARGVGKTTTARLLAKALNCAQGPTAEPCNVCASCTEIAAGNSMDVHEIDAASNTGVDNVRDVIISTISITPARDRYKVFIIDEVHMLSTNAFNALLKTLEEPPPHVVFIMATTELHKVPDTILSRCQQFEFRTIPPQKILDRLRLIAREEGVTLSDAALGLVVRAGEGSMRDAQSAFDQVISFAGKEVKDADVTAALGIIGAQTLNALVAAVAGRDIKAVLALVDELVSRGYDLRNFTREAMGHFRHLLVIRAVGFDRELLPLTEGEAAELLRLAEHFSEADLLRFFNVLTKVEQDIKASTQERFQLELGLIKLVQMARLSSLEELLERVKRLEQSLGGGAAAPPQTPRPADPPRAKPGPARPVKADQATQPPPAAPVPVEPQARGPQPPAPELPPEPPPELNEPPPVIEPVVESLGAGGDEVIDRIKSLLEARKKMRVLTALDSAERVTLVGGELRVTFAPKAKVFAEQLGSRDTLKLLEEVAGEAAGRKVLIAISGGGISTPVPAPAAQPSDAGTPHEAPANKRSPRERANSDPIVQAFVKTFRGQIVDVKPPDQ